MLGRILLRRPLELPFTKHTLADLIGFVFALNYEKLVPLPVVASRFEVEKVLIGITSDKMGVAIQDIKPESSFTQDLGIDCPTIKRAIYHRASHELNGIQSIHEKLSFGVTLSYST